MRGPLAHAEWGPTSATRRRSSGSRSWRKASVCDAASAPKCSSVYLI